MAKLIIARHHESEWNKLGQWTGLEDVRLTPYGCEKSEEMGTLLQATYPDLHIDYIFTSKLIRAEQTLNCMLKAMHIDPSSIPTEHETALNERDYGDYTGKNKWDIKIQVGEDDFDSIRRDWDHHIPRGETLKMVYERSVPFFISTIIPLLKEGKNILITSHGNTIRTLVKYIDNISDEGVRDLEIPFGSILVYDYDESGVVTNKKILQVDSRVNA
ncbi:MAG: 2,3-bisphosphoglycerate-dependent phosphoglycerate mutase [bacterium]